MLVLALLLGLTRRHVGRVARTDVLELVIGEILRSSCYS